MAGVAAKQSSEAPENAHVPPRLKAANSDFRQKVRTQYREAMEQIEIRWTPSLPGPALRATAQATEQMSGTCSSAVAYQGCRVIPHRVHDYVGGYGPAAGFLKRYASTSAR